MTRKEAHRLLNAAVDGAEISRTMIDKCLRKTGDLSGMAAFLRQQDEPPGETVDSLHRRLLVEAQGILKERGYDRVSDEFAIGWAETILRQNPHLERRLTTGEA